MPDTQFKSAPVTPTSRDISAYVLDFITELGELAEAYGQTALAADLRRVGAQHSAPQEKRPA